MGGAGTAVGNDSAMPYLNPAGLAGLPGDVFAVSASLYQYERRTFENLFRPRGLAPAYGAWSVDHENIESSSVSELPTSVMYVSHVEQTDKTRQLAGMALVVPSRERLELRGESKIALPAAQGFDRQTTSASSSRTDYYVGPTWAMGIGESVRIGASLFGLYTQVFSSSEFNDFTSLFGGTQISSSEIARSQDIRTFSIVPVVGAQVEVSPRLWLGAGAAVPSIHLWGHERTLSRGSGASPSGTPSGVVMFDSNYLYDGDATDGRPFRLNVGVAYEDRSAFSGALDVTYFADRPGARSFTGRRRGTDFRSDQIPRQVDEPFEEKDDLISVIDVAAGGEIALSSVSSLRAGGFGDLANTPEIENPTGGLYRIRENRFGATLGLGTTFGSFDSTIGVVYAHSEGRIVVLDVMSTAPTPFASAVTRSDAVMLLFSGSVTVAEAKETIRRTAPVPPVTWELPTAPLAPAPGPAAAPPSAPPAAAPQTVAPPAGGPPAPAPPAFPTVPVAPESPPAPPPPPEGEP